MSKKIFKILEDGDIIVKDDQYIKVESGKVIVFDDGSYTLMNGELLFVDKEAFILAQAHHNQIVDLAQIT